MRLAASVAVACVAAAVLAAAAEAEGLSPAELGRMILEMHDRWHLGEGMAVGDTYRYAICDAGLRVGGTCYRAALDVVAHVADGAASYYVIQLSVQDIVTSRDGQRQMTGIYSEDRMRMGYWDAPGTEMYLLLLDDDTMEFSATDALRGDEYAASLSRTIGLLGGEIRIGSGNLMDFPAVLDVGQTWNLDGSVIVKSKPGQYACTDAERGSIYGCDGFVLDSADVYEASYGQQREMARFVIVDGLPFPVSADIGESEWRSVRDKHVGSRAWYRMTDMHSDGAAFQAPGPASPLPDAADAMIMPSVTIGTGDSAPVTPPEPAVQPGTDGPQEADQMPAVQPGTDGPQEADQVPDAMQDDPAYEGESWYECGGIAGCVTGTVTGIVDGDTLDVGDTRIRLALVNTPERGESGYDEAAAFTSEICPVGHSAKVDVDDGQIGGSFGRIIGSVVCGDLILNEELAYSDHAGILTEFCGTSEFGTEWWAVDNGC